MEPENVRVVDDRRHREPGVLAVAAEASILLALLDVVGLECLELAQAAGAIRMFPSEPGKQAAGRRELEVSLVLFVPTHAQVNPKTKAHNPPAALGAPYGFLRTAEI
tara:strand:+ start:473 stop:793 length:321 start_codon:yes stop_codon:yes gene_type:complete